MPAAGTDRQDIEASGMPALEAVAAVVIALGVPVLVFNWFTAYGCWWSCSNPVPANQVTYTVVALIVVPAVVWTMVSAWRREASWIYLWHGPAAFVALAVVILCAVPSFEVSSPEQPEHTPWTGCVEYSGGGSDCPGG